eukprot:Rhum_TRINITY_DN5688_c0_g1::Rhum_TRINITY_DN5688_c0_g1_i1::g.17819::m.17819
MGVVISPLLRRLDKGGLERLRQWLALLQDAGVEHIEDTAEMRCSSPVGDAVCEMSQLGIVSVSSVSKLLSLLPLSCAGAGGEKHPQQHAQEAAEVEAARVASSEEECLPVVEHLPLTALLISTAPAAAQLNFLPMILDLGCCKLARSPSDV